MELGTKMSARSDREFAIVVFGATGLTGRLIVEQLARRDTLSEPTPSRRI